MPVKAAAFEVGLAAHEALQARGPWREQADKIVEGYVYFNGSEPIQVGLQDIDWRARHRDHQEWKAQLHRFGYLVPLAIAFRKTGDSRYASAARSYMEDWLDQSSANGGEVDPIYRSPLCLSIRVGTSHHTGWCGTLPIFATSAVFDTAFVQRLLDSVEEQLTWLMTHMTPLGNFRVSQFDALLMTALRHPELAAAPTFRKVGARGLRNVLHGQFLADGAHFEMAPSYASWMTRVLADYAWLQQEVPGLDLGIAPRRVRQALAYVTHGQSFPVNDSWRSKDGCQPQLALNRRLLGRLEDSGESDWSPALDQVFPQAGQVFLRSGWEDAASTIGFDASPWGSTHTHASRLSVHLRHGNRDLIADPGILDYEMSNPLAAHGKSTRAHSTLCLNGLNQGQSGAHLLRTESTERCALIHARYDSGYWDGPLTWGFKEGCGNGTHGSHDRLLFWVRDEYVLIMDVMVASPGNQVYNNWQLGSCEETQLLEDRYAVRALNADTSLHLQLVVVPAETTMSIAEGQTTPPRGWVRQSSSGTAPVLAPQVSYRYPAGVPAGGISAVLAMPFDAAAAPEVEVVQHVSGPGGIAQLLILDLGDGRRDVIGWSPQLAVAIELGDAAQSDCPFFWLRQQDQAPPHEGYLLDGSYVLVPAVSPDEELTPGAGYWGGK